MGTKQNTLQKLISLTKVNEWAENYIVNFASTVDQSSYEQSDKPYFVLHIWGYDFDAGFANMDEVKNTMQEILDCPYDESWDIKVLDVEKNEEVYPTITGIKLHRRGD